MENKEIEIIQFIQKHRIQSLDTLFVLLSSSTYISIFIFLVSLVIYGYLKKCKVTILNTAKLCAGLVINSAMVGFLKLTVNRERPYEISSAIEVLSLGRSPSFPSGHTAASFLFGFAFLLLFRGSYITKGIIFLWAVNVAYSRLVLGAHFPTDVLCSILLSFINSFSGIYLVYYIKGKFDNRVVH